MLTVSLLTSGLCNYCASTD